MTTWSEAPAERSRTWSVLGVPIDSVGAPEGGPLFGTELAPGTLRSLGIVDRRDLGQPLFVDQQGVDQLGVGKERAAFAGAIGDQSVDDRKHIGMLEGS